MTRSLRPRLVAALLGAALVVSSCAGSSVLVVGENVRAPEPPPPRLTFSVVAADNDAPISGAEVAVDGVVVLTDESGSVTVDWPERPIEVEATARGFQPVSVEVAALPAEQPMALVLPPVVLSGRVVTLEGEPIAGVTVTLGSRTLTTDVDGRFSINRALPGEVEVRRPAWVGRTMEWDGTSDQLTVALETFVVRGLRVSGPAAGDPIVWDDLLGMAESTAINTMVVDIKDERGVVMHDSQVPLAREIGSVRVFYDIHRVVADIKERGLYAITRIVVFQDPILAVAKPELAAWDLEANAPWENYAGRQWLDPTDEASWEYSLDLAVEGCEAGFDEIQFDYVRFPSDGPVDNLKTDGSYDPDNRIATVVSFLEEAKSRLHPLGCAVSADIFAIVISVQDEQGIGQRPEEISAAVDVVSPMIYPSHYGAGWRGLEEPNDHPAQVVGGALDDGMPRLQGGAFYRPWLQAFGYDPDQILAEIAEAEQRGLGWMLWHANSVFADAAVPDEG